MNKIFHPFKSILLVLIYVPLLLSAGGPLPSAPAPVNLSNARFNGLTRILVTTNAELKGITAAEIVITKPDGTTIVPAKIRSLDVTSGSLSVVISADQFARITSQGTTIATKAFGSFGASRTVKVQRVGESAANGHIIGASQWTDEGWSTSQTDPRFVDPVTGQSGLYRFVDLTPNEDEHNKPVDWKDGNIVTPAHRARTMLVLFVEFPDRRAADAGDPYTANPPYLEFLKGAVDWFGMSSYGQFRLMLASPQSTRNLGWIMMSKNAAQYDWNGQTHTMFAYVKEACQLAYDHWKIKADDYDMLLIMPARGRAGLFNGPANINRDPSDGEQPNTSLIVYVDGDNKPHFIGTAITAGNDMFRWGYRWLTHESGHTFGFPDLYMYAPTTVNGVRVNQFFFCGGWDMMGNIAGHSTDYLGWHKWKLRWIRDDQVDVVSQSGSEAMTYSLSPIETPGGSKIVVIRTGLSTAYVAEFRTKLGINALDGRGKYSGVLLYRIDASCMETREKQPTAQIISKQYYRSEVVGGPKNLTGVWRPIDNTINGYDSPECTWQPGDVFSDPATGVTIHIDSITNCNAAEPNSSPYTAEDVATITITKTISAELFKSVALRNPQLKNLTDLTFDTNIELQQRIPNANGGNHGTYTYVREESVLTPGNLVITKANGSVIPEKMIGGIVLLPNGVQVTLAKGAFKNAADAAHATIATKAYYHFGAGAPVRIEIR